MWEVRFFQFEACPDFFPACHTPNREDATRRDMPTDLRLLNTDLIEKILSEAREVLSKLGMEIHNPGVLALLGDHGAEVDSRKHRASAQELIDKALATVPLVPALRRAGERDPRLRGRQRLLHARLGGHQHPGRPLGRDAPAHHGRLRPLREADERAAAHRLPEHRVHSRRRAREYLGQLPAVPEPALRREAGGHGRLHHRRRSRS